MTRKNHKSITNKIDKVYKLIVDNYNKVNEKYKSIVFSKKNIIKSFMPNSIFSFFIFCIFAISILFLVADNKDKLVDENSDISSNIGALLVDGYDFNLSSVTTNENADKICFRAATYARKNKATYKYEVKKENELIYEYLFNTDNISDGDNVCFDASMIDFDEKDKYTIIISPVYADSSNTITFFASDDGVINYSLYKKEGLLSVKNLLLIIYIIIFLILNYLINNKKLNVEKIWILYVLVYLLPLSLLVPPFEVPDEPAHFYAAYKFSQIDYSNFTESKNNGYITSPKNLDCLNYSDFQVTDKVKDLNDITECLKEDENEKNYFYWQIRHVQTKIAYIFSALGIFIADLISNSPLIIFDTGRILNVLGCAIILYYALKITPKYKEVMLFIATIPMFVQQFCSYNYDSIVFALGLLGFAIILDYIYNKENNVKKYSIPLFVSSIFISDIKYIYLLLFTTILFMPSEKFKKKWHKYLYIIMIFGLSFIIGRITLALASNDYVMVSSGNFEYLLHNPLEIFPLVYNTFAQKTWFYIQGLYGYFGWFKFHLENYIIIIYLLFTGYIVLSNRRKKHGKFELFVVIISWLLCFAGVFAAMYFGWSARELNYIDGVQGRYFILMLFPMMYLLFSSKPVKNDNEEYEKNVKFFTNLSMIYYILLLIVVYY